MCQIVKILTQSGRNPSRSLPLFSRLGMRITIASDEPKELEDALALLLREELALDFGVRQMQLPASAALAHTILSLTT